MKKLALSLMALTAGAVLVSPAFADNLPYTPYAGFFVPTASSLTATGNTLNVYFYGSSAADSDNLKIQDVTAGWTSGPIFNNQSSTAGQKLSFNVNPNDVLVLYLVNETTGKTYSSDPSDSADGYNHAYFTTFSGNGTTPAGTYVGLEDQFIGANSSGICGGQNNLSDCDFNDSQLVLVNAVDPPLGDAPEPSSLALLGTSILGGAGLLRRRFLRS